MNRKRRIKKGNLRWACLGEIKLHKRNFYPDYKLAPAISPSTFPLPRETINPLNSVWVNQRGELCQKLCF